MSEHAHKKNLVFIFKSMLRNITFTMEVNSQLTGVNIGTGAAGQQEKGRPET